MNALPWSCVKGMIGRTLALIILVAMTPLGLAQPLTIHEIQSNTIDGDLSYYDGTTVDCVGGICVAKRGGDQPRLMLLDPNYPGGWGGIQVKDRVPPYELTNTVQIGDWVEFTDILVEERRGTTFLQWVDTQPAQAYAIVSQNNVLPVPLQLPAAAVPAPIYDPGEDGWFVENHDAEPYESMRVAIADLTVTAWNLGKAGDNYNLRHAEDSDVWAGDYLNPDVGDDGYHPYVEIGRHFSAVVGIVEQYWRPDQGWDYYQIVTMKTGDLGITGDLNCDGVVDFDDIDPFIAALSGAEAYYDQYPDCNWLSADCDASGVVDFDDIDAFVALLGG